MTSEAPLTNAGWRKSSFSGGGGNGGGGCVEIAALAEGRIAIRDSKNPDGGVLFAARAEINSWVDPNH